MFKKFAAEMMLRAIKFGSSITDTAESKVAHAMASAMLNKDEFVILNFKKLKINEADQMIIVTKLQKLYDIFEHPELKHIAVIRF